MTVISSTKAPFPWYGGKSLLSGWIVSLLPPHRVYIEPFGGSGAVLFAKHRSHLEVYNDLDEGLISFMRVLRDQPDELVRRLRLTPHSRQEYLEARVSWAEQTDDIERARRWYVTLAQSFAAKPPGSQHTGWNGEFQGVSHVPAPSAWVSNVEQLLACADRLRDVQIEHLDAMEILDRYDHEGACFYLDPPYVHDTRKQGSTKAYSHEQDDAFHASLVNRLLALSADAILSGYPSPLYDPLRESGWQYLERPAITRFASGRGARGRMEALWIKSSALTLF